MEKQKDVRLNKDFRNAYVKDFRSFLERQTNNPKYQSFLEARENCKGKIDDAFLLNFYAGYDFMNNYRISAGVNNATDLEYIASRHPNGARRGAPLTAYVKAVANF